MRSFILVPVCLRGISATSQTSEEAVDASGLMQLRIHKNRDSQVDPFATVATAVKAAVDYVEMAYEAPYVCGKWSAWGECSASCGGGLQSRTYTHIDGVQCGKSCPHGNGDIQQRECNTEVNCPVDCEGEWGEYSGCSASCGGGVQSRVYKVTQQALHGGKQCPKANGAVEDHPCSTEQCEVHCSGHWQDWSECSNGGAGPGGMECGPGGMQHRNYSVDVEHTSGGCECKDVMFGAKEPVVVDGSTVDSRSCELPCCPEPCEGAWSKWGQCEGPNLDMMPGVGGDYEKETCCGGGTKTRTFSITKEKVCNGACCEAPDGLVETDTCCDTPCPVHCEGHWSEPGACCSECGGGMMESVWIIDQEAMHGGKQCKHKEGAIKREACNTQPCPVHCEGEWSAWEECTETCEHAPRAGMPDPEGTQTRHFIVTKIAEHGGNKCKDEGNVEIVPCGPPADKNTPEPCPIPATCGWTDYGECDAECSHGPHHIIKKYRKWVELTPAEHGGAECKDSPPAYENDFAICSKTRCPIPCVGHWSEYSTCNAQIANPGGFFCGGGSQTRHYIVTQEAQFDGQPCCHAHGATDSKPCGETHCPINCKGDWTEWGHCCSSCGGGSRSRSYQITVPAQYGGLECPVKHEHVEHEPCNTHPCPIDCEGAWGAWSDCSNECTDCRNYGAVGSSERMFSVSVKAEHGGLQCPHPDGEKEQKTCNEHCCPEDCEGSWSEFGECSTSCGNGVTERFYAITHHAAYGGKECPVCDKASHTKACEDRSPCPIDCSGEFTEWSQCSAQCGGGEQYAWFIVNSQAQHGGQECEHGPYEMVTRPCNEQPCPQRCLGMFMGWGKCSEPCSGGIKKRAFKVFRPAAGGGPECPFEDGFEQETSCNTHDCPEGYVCPPEKTCKYSSR